MSEGLKTAVMESAERTPSDNRQEDALHLPGDHLEVGQLKQRTAQGALISTGAQIATFALRTGSMVILARMLIPKDFGLVGMVTAFTGFLALFRDVGLSMATVQRASITREQTSTLFWINLALGGALGVLCVVLAPAVVAFYGEPRLFWVTVAMGLGFIFNGASVQHRALLQRAMRFASLAVIDIICLTISIVAGIAVAASGLGYWSLVVSAVSLPALSIAGVWLAARWLPGLPRRGSGIRSMLRYGGTVTLNNVIVYFAYNIDKILIGRVWGAETLGVYGRAYYLINLPTENLNATIGLVAFPALSRIQNDPVRLRSYFLKGYGFFLSLIVPLTMGCALFANDIIRVFLGPKWHEAASVFRLLSPTIFVFALINPLAWLMLATGHAARSLKMALVIAPVVIVGYALGLQYGPKGVAAGFSIAMLLLLVPMMLWAKHGSLITNGDLFKVILQPFSAVLIAAAITVLLKPWWHGFSPVILRLSVGCVLLFGVYFGTLLFVMGQRDVFLDTIRQTHLWPAGRRKK